MYTDEENQIFATIISNSDLIENGFETDGNDFRIVIHDLREIDNF